MNLDLNWLNPQPASSVGADWAGFPYRTDVTQQMVAQNLNTNSQGWSSLSLPGKMGVIGQGVGAFSTLANIYAGFKALQLQEKQFDFAKNAWNKNYANQVKDYENELKDRWAARSSAARTRGRTFESMGSWVGSRALTGQTPASHNAGGGG